MQILWSMELRRVHLSQEKISSKGKIKQFWKIWDLLSMRWQIFKSHPQPCTKIAIQPFYENQCLLEELIGRVRAEKDAIEDELIKDDE